MDEDSLVEEIRSAAQRDKSSVWYPTVGIAHIEFAEEVVGFKFPELLRRILMEVSNGGFGPGYKLGGLPGGHDCAWGDILESFKVIQADEGYEDGWLPVIDWGCAQVTMIDCFDKTQIVTWLSGDVRQEDYDFNELMRRWVNGEQPNIDDGTFVPIDHR